MTKESALGQGYLQYFSHSFHKMIAFASLKMITLAFPTMPTYSLPIGRYWIPFFYFISLCVIALGVDMISTHRK